MGIKQSMRSAFGVGDIKELAQREFNSEPKGSFEHTIRSAEGVRYWGSTMAVPGFEHEVRIAPLDDAQEEPRVQPPDFLSTAG